MTLLIFWVSLVLIVYTYVGFPMIIFLRGLWRQRPYQSAEITPPVSLIIAAYNEASSIGAKLDNVLLLDYPRERLDVIVVSDGSDDGTNEIVEQYIGEGIRLLPLPRQGKAPALNTAVAAAKGNILVFSDANSMYAPNAIRALVRPFADPEVGGVAGNQCYLNDRNSSGTGEGERSYWSFDRKLKQFQSQAGNVISATGAIYAIRRSLFQNVPGGVTDDFVTSTRIIAQGYRLVFAPGAVAYETVAKSSDVEFGRKVRVITRGLQAVLLMRRLLNPLQYGFYAFQLFSHKVLRRLIVYPLLALLVVSPFLWHGGLFYQLSTVGQVVFYGSGTVGALLRNTRLGRSKLFALPFFFCMVNFASLLASLNILRGHRIERWETQRQVT